MTSDGKLKVTASFYPMEFLVDQIGGSHVSVTELTKPGVEPHDLDLTPGRPRHWASPGSWSTSRACSPRSTTRSPSPA